MVKMLRIEPTTEITEEAIPPISWWLSDIIGNLKIFGNNHWEFSKNLWILVARRYHWEFSEKNLDRDIIILAGNSLKIFGRYYPHTYHWGGDLLRFVPSPKWVGKFKLLCTTDYCGFSKMINSHYLQY